MSTQSNRLSIDSATTTATAQVADESRRRPFVIIEASRGWRAINLRELWVYRELLYLLIWRDIKVRYKQTLLGVAWVVLQPVLTTLVFTIFLGVLLRVPTNGPPYLLFVYSGLLMWIFFSSAVTTSSISLVSNAQLLTKVYFPRSLLPVAAVSARLLDFAIGFVILILLMFYYGVRPTSSIFLLPVLIALMTLLTLAVGMIASALNVKYRDVGVLIPVLLHLWMYASPVVYPASLVPGRWRQLYELNPMAGLIGGFRTAVLGGPINWSSLAVSAAVVVGLVIIASIQFRRMENQFADVI
ncbi:MAG TPA: ABC transporter permease [Pyrinomonadaceae bacterium]|nr:ABC transporter permease [Pyrinomonadaceae bacterium]